MSIGEAILPSIPADVPYSPPRCTDNESKAHYKYFFVKDIVDTLKHIHKILAQMMKMMILLVSTSKRSYRHLSHLMSTQCLAKVKTT